MTTHGSDATTVTPRHATTDPAHDLVPDRAEEVGPVLGADALQTIWTVLFTDQDHLVANCNGSIVATGGNACVPRVPTPNVFTTIQCGSVFEAMKWEKRMETTLTGYAQWFIDSRGWGDLPQGTGTSWPVPFQELDSRSKPLYNGLTVSGPSTYGFGRGVGF